MERCYKILGISSNATKEEIKKAYHRKMKALHPDKTHGTALEDTATFLSTEINEAYKILISQLKNGNTTSIQKNSTKYLEEDIYIEGYGLLKYTISNNLNIILDAIIKRTGKEIDDTVDSIEWTLNTGLSENVKKSMNKHNMNYSMTTFFRGPVRYVIINKRAGKKWYIADYGMLCAEFFS